MPAKKLKRSSQKTTNKAAVTEEKTATVTVLYYDAPVGLTMHCTTLKDLLVSESGRVILTDAFRKDKSIIAILYGECELLNSLGSRAASQGRSNKR